MRLLAVALALACTARIDADRASSALGSADDTRVRLAADGIPQLFLKLVNDALKGSIAAQTISYHAPSSVVLDNAVLYGPDHVEVGRVRRAEATLALTSLFSGEIVISRIVLDGPALGLTYKDQKLNLLEALTPKKPPDPNKKNNTEFRIDNIVARGGTFTFTDGQNITIDASEIGAQASLNVDLGHNYVLVDVTAPHVGRGSVKLSPLDVPLTDIGAQRVRVFTDHIELNGVTAKAAGAAVQANGNIIVKGEGNLQLHGIVDAPKNAWPDRLKKLPFETPAVRAVVDVNGVFQNPTISVDGSFGKADAFGYHIESGRGVVDVTREIVTLKDGSAVKAGGTVAAVGTVKISTLDLDLKLRATDIALATILAPAKLEPTPRGSVSGRATVSGIADGEKPITIDANFAAARPEVSVVKVKELEGSARVVVRPKRVSIDAASVSGSGVSAKISGDVFTDEERIALTVDGTVADPTLLVAAIPPELRADSATFSGTVAGAYKSVKVEGRAQAASGRAYGVPIADLSGHFIASSDDVVIDDARAKAAGGDVTVVQAVTIKLGKQKAITGTATVSGADLALIKSPAGDALPLEGKVNGEAVLSGPYDDPTVTVRAAAGGLVVSGERLELATVRGVVTRKLLSVDDLVVQGGVADAHSDELKLFIDTMTLAGHVHVDSLELARVAALNDALGDKKLSGITRGLVTLQGDLYAPDVVATLTAENVVYSGQRYGDGNLNVTLAPDTPARSASLLDLARAASSAPAAIKNAAKVSSAVSASAPKKHLATVAAHLLGKGGAWDVIAAYAIERRVVNARAKLSDVDLAPFTSALGASVAPISGLASGIVRASGPLDKLDMRVHLKSPAISVPHASDATPAGTTPGALTTANLVTTRTLGAVLIDARMRAGALNARVCAFPETSAKPASTTTAVAPASEGEAGTPCSTNEHVWANIVGNLDAVHGAFDLAIDGNVEETSLEDLFPALAARTLSVGAQARVSAQIVRKEGKPVDVRAQATLVQASVQPQGSLRADLVGTTDVLYADGRVLLANDAHFVAPGGQIDVTVGGSVGTDEISLDVNGSVALGLAKAFSTQIANASGAATTTLKLRGRYDTGVVIEGSFEPHSGAVITPRALGQSITFQKGKITFAPASDASAGEAGLIRVSADNLRAHLGEGDVQLNGTADVRTKKLADKGFVARWDMAASGNNVDVKLAGNRAEGAFDLTLKGDESDPQLKGRVDITDGLYRKTLELRNFVLQAQPDKPSEALWVTLTPFGLENLDLEIAVSLANFRARANVANFDADMQLRGNLNVKSSIRLPQIDGAIEVEEGTVDFPRARFDIVEMQVEFPATGSGALIPHINMNARAELPPGSAGNDTEIPVDLDLDGDLVHGLNLDLSATDPQHEWTRSDLLGLILFGRTLSSAVAGGVDTSVAVRALMSEAAAPLTAELEQLAQTTLGVTLEIDPGGWRWQLGRRLQLEGPGLTFGTTTSTTTSTTGSTSTTTATTTYTNTTGAGLTTATAADPASAEDAVRLRLLILDHLGFGKNLSLVGGASSSAGSDLRLSLRFIEQ